MAFDPYGLDPTRQPGWPFGMPGGPAGGGIPGADPLGGPAPMGGPGAPYQVAGPTVGGGTTPGSGGGQAPGSPGGPAGGPATGPTSAPASTNAVPAQPQVGTVLPGNAPPPYRRPPEVTVPLAGATDPRHPAGVTPLPPAQPLSPGTPGGPGSVTESPAGQPPPTTLAGVLGDKEAMAGLGAGLGKLGAAFGGGQHQALDMAMPGPSAFDPSAASRSGAAKMFAELMSKRLGSRPSGGMPTGMLGR